MDLTEFKQAVIESPRSAKCFQCGQQFKSGFKVHHWGPHSGGWRLDSFAMPQWLYVNCEHCGYDTSLWKFGLARTLGD